MREVECVEERLQTGAWEALDHAADDVEAGLHEAVRDQRLALPEVDGNAVAPAHVLDEVAVEGEVAREQRQPLGLGAALEAETDVADGGLDLPVAARRDD